MSKYPHHNLLIVLSDGETFDFNATLSYVHKDYDSERIPEVLQDGGPGTVTVRELIDAIHPVLVDLEHYAATHGTGPDRRLSALKHILARLWHGV